LQALLLAEHQEWIVTHQQLPGHRILIRNYCGEFMFKDTLAR